MKPILHFKYEFGKFTMVQLGKFIENMKNAFSDKYDVILTPFELTNPTGGVVMFNFNGINYTYKQVIDYIESTNKQKNIW